MVSFRKMYIPRTFYFFSPSALPLGVYIFIYISRTASYKIQKIKSDIEKEQMFWYNDYNLTAAFLLQMKGDLFLNRELLEYAAAECGIALREDKEYMGLQKECAEAFKKGDYSLYSDLVCQQQALAEIICFLRGKESDCTHNCTRQLKNQSK